MVLTFRLLFAYDVRRRSPYLELEDSVYDNWAIDVAGV
jgi:hypothetical protein